MKLNTLKSLSIAALMASCIVAPLSAQAQNYNHRGYSYRQSDRTDEVDQVARESKNFRAYFEHNFRANGHKERRYDPNNGGEHPEHQGRNGNMTLMDTIQNTDEDFERLKAEVDRHGITARAHDLMAEIVDHAQDVDVRIGHVADYYYFGRNRSWSYDRSELYNRWVDLKADINNLATRMNGR